MNSEIKIYIYNLIAVLLIPSEVGLRNRDLSMK